MIVDPYPLLAASCFLLALYALWRAATVVWTRRARLLRLRRLCLDAPALRVGGWRWGVRCILPIALVFALPAMAQTAVVSPQEPVEQQLDALAVNVNQGLLNVNQALLNVVALAKQQAETARQLTAANEALTKQVADLKAQVASKNAAPTAEPAK